MSAILLDLPMELYLHALPAISRSTLAALLAQRTGRPRGIGRERSAATATATISPVGPTVRTTEAPPLGQRVHDAVLIAHAPMQWDRALGKASAMLEPAAAEEPDAVRAVLARDAFLRSDWSGVLARGLPEITLVWREPTSGLWLKARPDLLDPQDSTIWELKTVPRLNRAAAVAFLAQPRNVLQAAMYRAALQAATGRTWQFGWLVLEVDTPRRIERHDLPAHLERQGAWMLRDALAVARRTAHVRTPFVAADWAAYALEEARVRRLTSAHGV